MSVEKPNDKEMLWILSLFIDGELVDEITYNKYVKDADERDKKEGERKYEMVRNGCIFLINNEYAEDRINEKGSHSTILNKNCLEYYHRIKGREDRRQKAPLLPANEKINGWNGSFLKIIVTVIIAVLIIFLIRTVSCNQPSTPATQDENTIDTTSSFK